MAVHGGTSFNTRLGCRQVFGKRWVQHGTHTTTTPNEPHVDDEAADAVAVDGCSRHVQHPVHRRQCIILIPAGQQAWAGGCVGGWTQSAWSRSLEQS